MKSFGRVFKNAGFTLIEILISLAVLAIVSASVLSNFGALSRSESTIQRAALQFVSGVRSAQTQAVTTTDVRGDIPCGYGVHYEDGNSAFVFVSPKPFTGSCATQNRNYSASSDQIHQTIVFSDKNIEIKSAFADIFFEPPDPRTYINNNYSADGYEDISLGFGGFNCGEAPCKTIRIYNSGRIDVI
ncbi:MAG: hypothetical protein COV31_02545 [Candidatus Yanofskybacteria bacterium CG10_big_fil_rev_8_21_14_0_10_46_23]|uniref:General secretion pathway GspH domain-containing protein n=1 Tax=Candidatus Yanofskybacteria bacterium CG10_big_fil_rev_8_21_14_0_10_46_23 TaxID=1975098 RepID=A0A2H0R470_9BACT|nr:MAG: hypothetical protein COV31_02545 [Candidatus Yanofskybacteria bacterium CG10_big_fil_rev_8_21_14_0_10_46_23]